MPKIAFQDGQLHYLDEGKGTPLVLLHGFCETHRMWDDWKLKVLDAGIRLICVDLPGFGDSDCTAISIDEHANAVQSLIEHLRLKKVILIGHSMGGYISLAIVERQPAWLQGVGLFHSHPYADSVEIVARRNKAIEFIERNGHFHYIKQLVPRFFAPEKASSYRHQQDRLVLFASRGPKSGVINAIIAMRDRPDRSAVLKKTLLPMLLINGERDQTLSTEERQNQIALPQRVQLCFLPRAGHIGTIEASRVTQQAVRKFIRFCEEWQD